MKRLVVCAWALLFVSACTVPAETLSGRWSATAALQDGDAIESVGESPAVVVEVPAFDGAGTVLTLCASVPTIALTVASSSGTLESATACPDGLRTVVQGGAAALGQVLTVENLTLDVEAGASEGVLTLSLSAPGAGDGTGAVSSGTYSGSVVRE